MKTDEKVLALLTKVKQKKGEIKDAEHPTWRTNCSFGFDDKVSSRVNLQVLSKPQDLVEIVSFLLSRSACFQKACELLGLEAPGDYVWMGARVSDWISDVKTRLNQITISQKKKELDTLERKLDTLVSPEQKREMELAEIEKALG